MYKNSLVISGLYELGMSCVNYVTIDRDIFAGKYFACKFFVWSNFRRQTLATKFVQVDVHYTKYFAYLIFIGKGRRQKYFNDKNFMIYGRWNVWYMYNNMVPEKSVHSLVVQQLKHETSKHSSFN